MFVVDMAMFNAGCPRLCLKWRRVPTAPPLGRRGSRDRPPQDSRPVQSTTAAPLRKASKQQTFLCCGSQERTHLPPGFFKSSLAARLRGPSQKARLVSATKKRPFLFGPEAGPSSKIGGGDARTKRVAHSACSLAASPGLRSPQRCPAALPPSPQHAPSS